MAEQEEPKLGAQHGEAAGVQGSVSRRLWEVADEKCIPLGATLELTLGCNLACVHCYNFDRSAAAPRERTGKELSFEEIQSAIDQLAEAGCLYLSFTGGEALVHPRLEELIRYARSKRFVVKLKTNGSLLTDETVRMLQDAGVAQIDVSVYGATPETHDAFTRRPGSHANTVAGVRRAVAAGIGVRVNMSLVRANVNEVDRMVELARDLGCTYGLDPFITARQDGTTSSMEERIDRETLKTLYRGPLGRFLHGPDPSPDRSVQCACARSNVAISATGDVYPCIGAPIASGNIREQSFGEIWKDSPQLEWIRQLKLDDFETCKPCPDRGFCNRSSGVAYSNTGNYTGPEEFACMDAAVRRELHEEQAEDSPDTPQ